MKHYLLTFLTCIVIAVLSLFPIQELHMENMSISDKWAHFVMYGGLTAVILFDKNFIKLKTKQLSLPLWTLIFPIIYGGVMELLQAYCTNGNRSGDWLDFLANTLGALIVYALAWLLALIVARKWKS
ncbi:MAG: VanZ family protein [Prevotella sp.]|nr:VanZ family protein [Prevotella sp.]MCF0207899.1 VanZ family protein [Bacteroidaceae bacterium]